MRNKQVVRLTEGQLHNIIAESVNRVLNEGMFDTAKTMWQGAKNARALKGQADYYNSHKDKFMTKEGGIFPIADTICDQIENYCKSNDLDDWEVAKSIVGEICRRYRVNGIDYTFDGSIKRPTFTSLDGRNY